METKFCQSCGMPLNDEILGTNADGSKNHDYCIFCYKDGAFTGDFTMEEMVDYCSMFVEEYNKNSGQHLTACQYKEVLRKFYPSLKRWSGEDQQLPHANHPMKKVFIQEVNALGIKDLHIDNLFVLQGSFINQPYTIEGNEVKLFDDGASYWGNQVVKTDGRCYGIACCEKFIMVSEYGKDGADAQLVMYKRRKEIRQGFATPPAHVNFEAKKLFGAMGEIIDGAIAYLTLGGGGPVEKHTHPHNHLFIVVKGEARVELAEETVIIHENESFLVKGSIPHSVWNNQQDETIMIGISVRETQ